EETPSHHRVRTSLEFIALRTRKNVITIPKPPLLQTIETFTRDCIWTLVQRPRQCKYRTFN
ncbi:hypothetical protein M9458_052429, partial [Cirrhinus mrigala]